MKTASLTRFAVSFLLFTGSCMYLPENFTEQALVIGKNETVSIPQLRLSITNKGCGRRRMGDGIENLFCELEVKDKEQIYRFGDSFAPFYIGNIELRIDSINPGSAAGDSLPPGGCRVIVKRLPDLSR